MFPRANQAGIHLFFGQRTTLDFCFSLPARQPISGENSPQVLDGFAALTDCSSIMQEAPDHYTSPCARSVEQRLLKFTNVPTSRANCRCGHAVNRMLQKALIGIPLLNTDKPVDIHKAFPLLVNISYVRYLPLRRRISNMNAAFFPHFWRSESLPFGLNQRAYMLSAESSSVCLWAAKHDSAAMPTSSATNPPPICFSSSGFAKECFSSCHRQTE